MTDLIVIRHGQTDYNLAWRFQGHIDVPLNDTGLAQAQRLARRLAAEPAPAQLISSDLSRARQTAAPLGLAWRQDVQAVPGLREQGFGVLEGLDAAQIRERHPDLWARWQAHRADTAPPGGESTRAFHARVLGTVRDLAEAAPGRRLVLVTHGGVLDMLWRTAHGLPLDGARDCAIPNCGINRLRWRAGTLEIEAWADAAHLEAHSGGPAPPG